MKMMRLSNVLQNVVISFFNIDALIVLFLFVLVRRITSEILMGSQETKQLQE